MNIKTFKRLSFKVFTLALLLTVVSGNSIIVANYICSDNMEETEQCCCPRNDYFNTNEHAQFTRTNCGCCITQGQPVNTLLPPITVPSNNLIQNYQYAIISDINNNGFYTTDFNIIVSNIPLITQDINILNANLRI